MKWKLVTFIGHSSPFDVVRPDCASGVRFRSVETI
jgi:hypothetical protein